MSWQLTLKGLKWSSINSFSLSLTHTHKCYCKWKNLRTNDFLSFSLASIHSSSLRPSVPQNRKKKTLFSLETSIELTFARLYLSMKYNTLPVSKFIRLPEYSLSSFLFPCFFFLLTKTNVFFFFLSLTLSSLFQSPQTSGALDKGQQEVTIGGFHLVQKWC